MRMSLLFSVFVLFLAANVLAQPKKTAFDEHYEKGEVFVVVKCLSVGAMNILMRADVEVEILHVIKGRETKRRITVNSQYGMQIGEYYLLRSTTEPNEKGNYFRIDERNSVIRIVSEDEVQKLPSLDPKIAVRRTMNIRSDELESRIRTLMFEKEALDSVSKDY